MSETTRNRPKIAVFAYSEVGFACLACLLRDGANVAVVFTHEDDPAEEIWFRSVAELAESRGIPVRRDAKIGPEAARYLRGLDIELILSFYYRAMIPGCVLAIPRLGAYNMHGALLPKYRGRACINWAVLNGEAETGATLHVMTERADRGDIVDQMAVPIAYDDTAQDVFRHVAEAADAVLSRSLSAIESGRPPLVPQDESQASHFGRRRPEDGVIDWTKHAEKIYNQVRALTHPFPGAFAELDGKKTFIWRARARNGTAKPGEIVSREPFLVGTGKGLIEILSWQPEGEAERSIE